MADGEIAFDAGIGFLTRPLFEVGQQGREGPAGRLDIADRRVEQTELFERAAVAVGLFRAE
ncbi:hypothetical protein X739_05240 [Mesorhizobium sp. LNHC220B00]|nr:hypothetical protein [Mesorhizobium sp. LNHC220B00]ESY88032.1 hypothetical protein X739_05240 [Mesorhizobium sp. LNHC220B00]